MRRGSNLGWIVLIMAPFALVAKSLQMFGKAIGTLLKPRPQRMRERYYNHLLEDNVKQSRINLNKARQGKIHAEIKLINAKKQAILNDSNTADDTFTKVKLAKLKAEVELIKAKVKKMRSSGGWSEQLDKLGIDLENMGVNLDDLEVNAKDFMGCAECNFIDSTGKETKCHTCGKPLRPIHTGI